MLIFFFFDGHHARNDHTRNDVGRTLLIRRSQVGAQSMATLQKNGLARNVGAMARRRRWSTRALFFVVTITRGRLYGIHNILFSSPTLFAAKATAHAGRAVWWGDDSECIAKCCERV